MCWESDFSAVAVDICLLCYRGSVVLPELIRSQEHYDIMLAVLNIKHAFEGSQGKWPYLGPVAQFLSMLVVNIEWQDLTLYHVSQCCCTQY